MLKKFIIEILDNSRTIYRENFTELLIYLEQEIMRDRAATGPPQFTTTNPAAKDAADRD